MRLCRTSFWRRLCARRVTRCQTCTFTPYNLSRAQDIFSHLDSVLNMGAGPISGELRSIYRYCIKRLFIANAENRIDYMEEVINLVESLRSAWQAAELVVASERSSARETAIAAGCA